MNPSAPKLLIIDATGIIHRMYRAVERSSTGPSQPEAMRLVQARISELLRTHKPDAVLAAFDVPGAWTWRHDRHAGYKASRPPKAEQLVSLMRSVWKQCLALGITPAADPAAEADDIIAEAAKLWRHGPVVVAAHDKDLFQLIDDRVVVYDPVARAVRDAAYVRERYKIEPRQMSSYLALVGDSTDDVPGVAGIGPVAAARLLAAHRDWPEVREAAETLEGPDYRKVLANRVMGDLSFELTGFAVTQPIPAIWPYAGPRETGSPAAPPANQMRPMQSSSRPA